MEVLATNMLRLPKALMSEGELSDMRRALTFIPRFADDGELPVPIELYQETPTHIHLPRAWAEKNFEGFDKAYSRGQVCVYERFPDPYHPAVKNPEAQACFMQGILAATETYNDFRVSAATGSGKTVCALNTIARLGVNALVVVPTENLAAQWRKEAKLHLGLTDDQIGLVQGDVCDYQGKHIVITIINSLSMKDYPQEFYDHFAITVVDECHRIGSAVFSRGVPKMNSFWRIGLSATHKRKDGADIVLEATLGDIVVTSEAEALKTRVIVLPYNAAGRVWGNTHGALVKCLSVDRARNAMITDKVLELYERGRQILIVSDSIEHLQKLIALAVERGIPREIMGQFTGQQYLPEGKKRKITQEELDFIKKNSQIIFATYQMMKEGVDIPRLDAGIDATPRADAIQLVGRIRRVHPNKPMPEWYTIVDVKSGVLKGYYKKRKREYLATNMEVIEYR